VVLFTAVHTSLPGTFETSTDVRATAALGSNPDIEQTSPDGRDDCSQAGIDKAADQLK
jgi:hypothetical protein